MPTCFFELRKQSARGSDSIAADIMRHLHTRQHLGKTIIVCDQPKVMLSAGRKQWLKIARSIQKRRASTLNADKILKYTHSITRMQHMRFTTHSPLEDPDANIYCIQDTQLSAIPHSCYSIYLAATLPQQTAEQIAGQLPADALVIDYLQNSPWPKLGLQPKKSLEEKVQTEWQRAQAFMSNSHIDIAELLAGNSKNIDAMDDALDFLLNVSNKFLEIADSFQHALELARPLKISKDLREQYDVFSLLAHRVQALSRAAYTQRFLETYNEDDTFFLYDHARKRFINTGEGLPEAIARHNKAGRSALA